MSKHEDKCDRAVEWFMELEPPEQEIAVRHLFEHAIVSEWIGVWDDPIQMAEKAEAEGDGTDQLDRYMAPYFKTTGEPIHEA